SRRRATLAGRAFALRPGPDGRRGAPGYIPGIVTDLTSDLARGPSSDLAFACALADAADAITMERFRARDLVVETKPDLTPVTEADRAVEVMIRERLGHDRAGDAVLGEEFGTTGAGSRRWIVDPIDGTKGYARGI